MLATAECFPYRGGDQDTLLGVEGWFILVFRPLKQLAPVPRLFVTLPCCAPQVAFREMIAKSQTLQNPWLPFDPLWVLALWMLNGPILWRYCPELHPRAAFVEKKLEFHKDESVKLPVQASRCTPEASFLCGILFKTLVVYYSSVHSLQYSSVQLLVSGM